jgi:[protein-PII] uridylyltransferase
VQLAPAICSGEAGRGMTFAEKVENHAARRLAISQAHTPAQEIVRYKDFLKVENHRVHLLHKRGESGLAVCQARATAVDVLLRSIVRAIEANLRAQNSPVPKYALVALGGYGRGELNPYSDIDILFLHETDQVTGGRAKPSLKAIAEGVLYVLWDCGLKVGHVVRSAEDCVAEANSNMQSKTALIQARLVGGDEALFKKMRDLVTAKAVRGFEREYIEARIDDQETRRTKHGNAATMQEPNIKNGCGGLRDYQNLIWMAYFKYRASNLEELEKREFISSAERRQLDAAYDFLLKVRTELHYQSKRAVDVLPKSLQPVMATALGYRDPSPSKRLEMFMRDVYTHMRNIYLITRTLEQRLALLPGEKRKIPSLRDLLKRRRERAEEQIVDGFRILDGKIYNGPRTFKEQPRRMMRAFLHAQARGLQLDPDLAQSIRNSLSLVNREFMQDTHVRETFLEILNQRGNVAPTLRAMHEVGLLGKYLPEFGKLTCLVQHEFYHQYTADEHTLVCVEKLDKVWESTTPPFSNYARLFQNVERPFVLYLALLLHDAGKAYHSGKHAEVGGDLAITVASRLELDGATTHSLRLIIENHLAMVQISQRRDLEDPSVIKSFAAQIQSKENLDMLTLHTFADSQGTSEQLWNGFKDSLLWGLYDRAARVLQGQTEFITAKQTQLAVLRDEVTALLPPTFAPDEVEAHFATLPPRYFQIRSAREIVAEIVMAHRFMHLQLVEEDKALEPVITWHNEPDRGYTTVQICTWDRAGLFAKIAGSLTAAGLNILSGQVFTRLDGIVLDSFYVTDAKTGTLPKKEEKELFEKILAQVLTGEIDLRALIAKQKPAKPLYKAIGDERIPTVITFDNVTAEKRTIIDLETEDRVGLLYVISQAFIDLGLDLALAKIVTEKGAAIDSFYVRYLHGWKIESKEQQKEVEARLREAIASLS